jgi:hypothetical protein
VEHPVTGVPQEFTLVTRTRGILNGVKHTVVMRNSPAL